jgi:hypothetical protein
MKEHIFKIIILFIGAALMVACRPKAEARH